jgi:hypothetical protein
MWSRDVMKGAEKAEGCEAAVDDASDAEIKVFSPLFIKDDTRCQDHDDNIDPSLA